MSVWRWHHASQHGAHGDCNMAIRVAAWRAGMIAQHGDHGGRSMTAPHDTQRALSPRLNVRLQINMDQDQHD
jgi:hypothetical protein